jgi:hypothetical protein
MQVREVWGALLPVGELSVICGRGANYLYDEYIYFEEIWALDKMYILVSTLFG